MSKGQTVNLGIITVALVSSSLTWLGNYVLNSPAKTSGEIAIVKKEQSISNERISTLEADNKSLTAWLTRIENKLDRALIK